ncbi:hypothetical protein SSPSH_002914 [Salinisphaera shabanensis E1L3A]|jgi:hypothetical protein|uniref:Uncharacterized protein n=1 Tax=Salinisphaera shabanensis E1L3A TaxID=1033802 RepID=U2E320_9GAMM|nr:hypothetical protein SSPSH_002914 [Salinisphaera shabanensis E1L3A]
MRLSSGYPIINVSSARRANYCVYVRESDTYPLAETAGCRSLTAEERSSAR